MTEYKFIPLNPVTGSPFSLRSYLVFYVEKVNSLRYVQLFETAWTVAYQGPPFMGFSR